MEAKHTAFWANFLRKRGIKIPSLKAKRLSIKLKIPLYRIVGLGLTLKLLEHGERKAITTYAKLLESSNLSPEELNELRRILEDELIHEEELIEESATFKDFLEHVRDAVLGMSDGLVEILSVTTGLAGVYVNPISIALAGFIVGIAGALSMGIGAFTSVRAQKHVRLGILSGLRLATTYATHYFKNLIINYMSKKGFSARLSEEISKEAFNNKELLARLIAEEKYGLREEKLEDPLKSGLYTGIFYILGALIPLSPYFMGLSVAYSLILSLVLAAIMLSMLGSIIALLAGLSIKYKALELIIGGLGSAAVTYLIGRLASTLLGIEVG